MAKINIYCDESCHLEHDGIKPMLLGCVWSEEQKKDAIFKRLRAIKVKYGLKPTCELKWNAVSQAKLAYYQEVMDFFFDNSDLHFRVLVVPDKSVLHHEQYGQTHDQFYYKMYFDLLKTILTPSNEYCIYLDIKDTNGGRKVEKLKDVLANNAYDYNKKMIRKIQQVRSHEVELIELADFLIGAVAYAHRGLKTSAAKLELVEQMKRRSKYSLLKSTLVKEDKVNIFVWKGRQV